MTGMAQRSTTEEARARADRIRSGMRVLAEWQQDVIAAYTARDWASLGYETWDAYLAGEYGEHRVQLPRDQRREIVAGMSAAGMSTRAIGSAIGAGNATVYRDLQASVPPGTDRRLDVVLSLDGRERPAAQPTPPGNVWVEPGADDVVDAEVVDEPFEDLLNASSLGAPHVRAETEPIPPQVHEQLTRAAKRRPLPEAFTDASHDLARIAERFDRLRSDDRFTRNRHQLHHGASDVVRALDSIAQLAADMDLPAAEASEEARRWWATSLHKISDALAGVANSLEQEKK